ncbi:helix-turn-helix domain-containing protein [Anaerotignum sp.]
MVGDDMMSRFPERLKELRKSRNISQQKLGAYLNYGYTAIANYESGRNEPSFDTLMKIAVFFDVTVDYLIGLSDEPMIMNTISISETRLLEMYRKLNEENKQIIMEMVGIIFEKRGKGFDEIG